MGKHSGKICTSQSQHLYTGASNLGFGCTFGTKSSYVPFQERWLENTISVRDFSKLLGEELSNTSVVKHSDSIVQVINKTSCKNFNFVKLMRRLKVASLINSTFIFIPSKSLAFIIQHRILCLAYKYRDSKELFLYVEIEETLVAHALLHL